MNSYKNINEYIKNSPKESRGHLKLMRDLSKKLIPKGKETIKYGMPTIELNGKNFLHYASMKNHFGFYPTPSGVLAFEDELKKRKIDYSKGCIRFPYNEPLPMSIVTKIIRFRLVEEKKKEK